MSHYYLCSKSKTIMKKSYFEYFIADYFPTLNKKDPVEYIDLDHIICVVCIPMLPAGEVLAIPLLETHCAACVSFYSIVIKSSDGSSIDNY